MGVSTDGGFSLLNLLKRFKCLWVGASSSIKTPIYDSMVLQLSEIHESIEEVRKCISEEKELLVKEVRKRDSIIQAMVETLPDMLWFKDTNGKYLYANKAIRDGLLFSDNPIGQTDVELSIKAKKRFGEREHTFGEVCDDSDKDVLENKYVNKKYVESGLVKGAMLHLEVNKSIVTIDDDIIGVVGSGRDITEYREELIKNGEIDVFERNEFINKDT